MVDATTLLPGQIVLGIGLVGLFIPLSNAALFGVNEHDSGAGGALLNATQQVGSAVGVAIFGTIYAAAASGYEHGHRSQLGVVQHAQVHGYVTAFLVASGVMVAAGIVSLTFIHLPKDAAVISPHRAGL